MAAGLLVAGTTSDAGKSLVAAALGRWLAREGVAVAPFKAQNMSNNSMVCADGAEIGRAQWLQARACRVEPEAAMNPVLLKPGSDRRSHVVVMGRPAGELQSGEWATGRRALAEAAFAAYDDLAARFDVIISEGAGSPAEVNLRAGDYVNLGLARAKNLPVLVVGDIDRGGVLAAMVGTQALLDDADRAHLCGWLINKFRGDVGLLRPGLDTLTERTGLPVLGVLPWLPEVWIDSEDTLAFSSRGGGTSRDGLDVAVVRLPRISNATDVDALAAEPGVRVHLTAAPEVVAAADLVILPGTRATVSDLGWVRAHGLDVALRRRVRAGGPVLGICGGYQMLGTGLDDPAAVESPTPIRVDGLGLLPVRTRFAEQKQLGRVAGRWRGHAVQGYRIHHGRVDASTPAGPAGPALEPFLDGVSDGVVSGTLWHGAFEADGFRRAFLAGVADRRGSRWRPEPGAHGFADRRERMLDRLADAVVEHCDTTALRRLLGG